MNANEDTNDVGELERQDEQPQPQPTAIFSEQTIIPVTFNEPADSDTAPDEGE